MEPRTRGGRTAATLATAALAILSLAVPGSTASRDALSADLAASIRVPSRRQLPPPIPIHDPSPSTNPSNASSPDSWEEDEPAATPVDSLSPAEYEALLRSVSDLDPGSGRALSAISSGATASELRWMLVTHSRRKRNVVQLGDMMKCATGCSPIAYKGYGCYCGFLGSGKIIDGIDQCCYYHDRCYQHSSCPSLLQYFAQYPWFCANETPICYAVGTGSACARELCECDRQFAKCLRRFPCPSSRPVCTSSPLRHWQNLFLGMRKPDSTESYPVVNNYAG